jgi:CheY-like chemotaxis protein
MARILIVDDEESDRLFERAILDDVGHTLFFASDGESALKAYRNHRIEIVITDLHMPGLNGLQLIRELKETDPLATIIAVSGVAAGQLGRALELGAAKTIRKPVMPSELLAALQEILHPDDAGDPWKGHARDV